MGQQFHQFKEKEQPPLSSNFLRLKTPQHLV
jgi:hypothetical protein